MILRKTTLLHDYDVTHLGRKIFQNPGVRLTDLFLDQILIERCRQTTIILGLGSRDFPNI